MRYLFSILPFLSLIQALCSTDKNEGEKGLVETERLNEVRRGCRLRIWPTTSSCQDCCWWKCVPCTHTCTQTHTHRHKNRHEKLRYCHIRKTFLSHSCCGTTNTQILFANPQSLQGPRKVSDNQLHALPTWQIHYLHVPDHCPVSVA